MDDRRWGVQLATMGFMGLAALALGAVLSGRCWFGTLCLGVPLLIFSHSGHADRDDDVGSAIGMAGYATLVQGLICAITGPGFVVLMDIGFIVLGFIASCTRQEGSDEVEEVKPKKRRRRRRRRRRPEARRRTTRNYNHRRIG